MNIENKVFKPGPNCVDESICGENLKECYEAHLIRTEMRYEEDEAGSSSLDYLLSNAKCQNSQAIKVRQEGRDLLDKAQ